MTASARSFLALGVLFVFGLAGSADDWPAFRGPHGTGISSETGLPVVWGPKQNVLWKIPLPGPGSSSPIVCGDRVFITCYTGYGTKKRATGDLKNLKRHLLCIDRDTGKVRWQRTVPAALPEVEHSGFMTEHGYASSTPATDGRNVYVFFGRTGVLAFDLDGNRLWHTEVGRELHGWGSGASPILYKHLVIVNAAVESGSLVALDKKTGKQVWRAKGIGSSWSTPLLVDLPGGKRELVLAASGVLIGFEPESGKKLWHCDAPGANTAAASPVAKNGVVYAMGTVVPGDRWVMAVRAGGRGDVTATHIVWQQKAGANVCSPIVYGDHLYWISGQVWCLRADTGKLVYQQRLYETRIEYSSPVIADGKIYAATRRDGTFVLQPGEKFTLLAHNELDDRSLFTASPAVSDGRLFLRSNAYLYCIGAKP